MYPFDNPEMTACIGRPPGVEAAQDLVVHGFPAEMVSSAGTTAIRVSSMRTSPSGTVSGKKNRPPPKMFSRRPPGVSLGNWQVSSSDAVAAGIPLVLVAG